MRDSRLRGPAIVGLGALWLLGWIVLYRWYPLAGHYLTPGFALDNAAERLGRPVLGPTAALFALLSGLYLGMAWLLARGPVSRRCWAALGALVLGAGALNVLTHPVAAVDVFYYISQLKLAYHYGANPYLTTFLPAYAGDPLAPFGGFLEWRLVYGPAWLAVAWPATLAGFALLPALLAYKGWSLLFLLLCGAIAALAHDDRERGRRAAFLLLANPLVLFEAVANAHNDIMVAALLVAAALAARRLPWLAVPLALVAVAVKALALPLLPTLALALARRPLRRAEILGAALLSLALLAAVTLPFWAGGAMLGGLLEAIRTQQTIQTSSLVSLLGEYLGMRGAGDQALGLARLACAAAFAVAWLAVALRVRDLPLALAAQLLLLYSLVSSFFPWYLLPALALLALSERPAARAYLLAAAPLALLAYPAGIWMRTAGGLSLFEMRLLLAVPQLVPVAWLVAALLAPAGRPQEARPAERYGGGLAPDSSGGRGRSGVR